MIKQKIFNWILLVFILTNSLFSQVLTKQEAKIYLWGLIKIPNDSKRGKVPIYDRLFRYREFAAPVNYMPIEIRSGLGVNGKISGSSSSPSANDLDNWIWFDNDATPLDQGVENIIGTSLDIDFGMINIPNIIMKTSWMNLLTGINYRSSSIISPKSIPDDWKVAAASPPLTLDYERVSRPVPTEMPPRISEGDEFNEMSQTVQACNAAL